MPTAEELNRIVREEGSTAINKPESAATALNPEAVWIRWHEVPGFEASDSRDRHYRIDHETGVITFGDGVNGKVPPRGANNIRLYRYQTGGGSVGNLPALAISQLKTTIPYVERAVNLEPAGGGADTESLSSLLEKTPRVTRHGFRAVISSDFEDLAMVASPAVARALCIAGYDLVNDPDARYSKSGVVSVIIVPRSTDPAPTPDAELLDRVRAYLDDRRPGELELILLGPEYVRIDVTAEIAIRDPGAASDIEGAVRRRLSALLHPLSGGTDGQGWAFGRLPAESDLYPAIEDVPGISHVRFLAMSPIEDNPGALARRRFLIRAGEFRIGSRLDD
jgi:predicted phage baseplate assembly protein